jgi:hypothetical protein
MLRASASESQLAIFTKGILCLPGSDSSRDATHPLTINARAGIKSKTRWSGAERRCNRARSPPRLVVEAGFHADGSAIWDSVNSVMARPVFRRGSLGRRDSACLEPHGEITHSQLAKRVPSQQIAAFGERPRTVTVARVRSPYPILLQARTSLV